MNRQQKRQAKLPKPDTHPISGKKVGECSSSELQSQLVTDALGGVETPVAWFLAACRRIGRLDRISEEEAFQRVRGEVASLGGFLPGGN
jgi:hypothetical protein